MNKSLFLTAAIALLVMHSQALSQSQELRKFEVAGEFTTLEREDIFGQRTEPGFGGRFTYNLNKIFSLETAGYFFPKRCFDCRSNGRVTEVLGGVKVGKRFEHWGVFAKGRPGLVSFSEGEFNIVQVPGTAGPNFEFEINRTTHFATDIGGVVEFYPSERIVTRFDAGDTLIHFGPRIRNAVFFDPTTNGFNLVPVPVRARTTHNFQFMASVGFRF